MISLDGWRIGQRHLNTDLLLVSSALSPPNLIVIENDNFYTEYELSVKKLVCLGFRGYLGEIESEKQKVIIFRIRIFAQSVVCQG